MISLIWAMDENRLIGKGNKLPWHIKEDLDYFKEVTSNQIVLMGHATYLSMKSYYKSKPLPFKKIYVANLGECDYEDATLIKDVLSFIQTNDENLFVVGGKIIYELALPFSDRLYITYIYGKYEGDVYFKDFDLKKYTLVKEQKTDKLRFAVYNKNI